MFLTPGSRSRQRFARPFPSTVRERLTADRTYYVRTDGNDGNSGLVNSPSGAFLTFQAAIDNLQKKVDLAGYNVTIQAGGTSGTFTGQILVIGRFVGQKRRESVKLKGDTTTPSNFVLQTTSGASNHVLYMQDGAFLAIEGFKMQTSGGSAQDCMRIAYGSHVRITGKMEFGAVTGNHMTALRVSSIDFDDGTGAAPNYTISGGGAVHWAVAHNSNFNAQGNTITLSGTPAFSGMFASVNGGTLIAIANTFSGAASAGTKQYDVVRNGAVQSGGATFPGGVAGTTSSGGQFT